MASVRRPGGERDQQPRHFARKQQSRRLERTHQTWLPGFEGDEHAVAPPRRVPTDREVDAAAENLDDETAAVPTVAQLLVLAEIDHLHPRRGRREQRALTSATVPRWRPEVPRLHNRVLSVSGSREGMDGRSGSGARERIRGARSPNRSVHHEVVSPNDRQSYSVVSSSGSYRGRAGSPLGTQTALQVLRCSGGDAEISTPVTLTPCRVTRRSTDRVGEVKEGELDSSSQ